MSANPPTVAFDFKQMLANAGAVWVAEAGLAGNINMSARKTRQAMSCGVANAVYQFGIGTDFVKAMLQKLGIPAQDKKAVQAVFQGLAMYSYEWVMPGQNVGFMTNLAEGALGAYGGDAIAGMLPPM